jgi:hypothetical protein
VRQALRARGATTMAVEAYGLPEHRRVITGHGLRPVPLPVDSDGAIPDGTVLSGADAALLTPANQFPLGMTLTPDRRRAFTAWAAEAGAVLIPAVLRACRAYTRVELEDARTRRGRSRARRPGSPGPCRACCGLLGMRRLRWGAY